MALKEKILEVISGPHVAAVATLDEGRPAVRFMVLNGLDDLTLICGTMKISRKVGQIKKDQSAAISIWSGKEFTDPYVVMQANGKIHDDIETKKKFWNPMFEQYFKSVDNPDWVVVSFSPKTIEWYGTGGMQPEVLNL